MAIGDDFAVITGGALPRWTRRIDDAAQTLNLVGGVISNFADVIEQSPGLRLS